LPHKIFVDTNVLLNPSFKYEDYEFVKTSIITVEELDGLKKSLEIGYKARDATRKLKEAKSKNAKVELYYDFSFENRFLQHKNDNYILGFAYQIWQDDNEFVFLTDDYALYIKAFAVGIPCDLFEFKDDESEKYNGIREIWLTDREYINIRDSEINQLDCFPNEYVIINNTTKNEQYLYVWNGEYLEEVKVKPITNKYLTSKDAVVPLDLYQKAFIHMLQNENVKIMITDSIYGAGKSYIMLHWALQQLGSNNNGRYNKMYFVKSDSPPDNRKPYPAIPGGILEKSEGILGVLCDTTSEDSIGEFMNRNNKIEVLPIQFAKSRSLRNSILFITEAQDFTPSEMERLISRIGEDTVVLLDGSTRQIDNKYCKHRNGLTVVSENFKNKSIAAQVNMIVDYRSEISKMVSEMDWHD